MLGWPVCCLSVHRFPVNLSLLLSVFCEVLIKSCDQVCSVFPDSETAVLWLQCVSCVPPPCLTSWRVWRAQAGWSTSKLFWMQASSSPRSVWRLILTVCLTVALNIGLGVGFVCVLYLLCVCVKPTSSIFAGTIREALEAFPQIYTNEPQPLTDEVVIIFIISLQCTAVPLLSWELHFKNNRR